MEEEKKVIRGYKGFDKDLMCRGFQYEVGKEYECERAVACVKGFHFCENPLAVLSFYPPFDEDRVNRFCEVEGSGKFDLSEENKICCTKIKIIREITLDELIEAVFRYLNIDIYSPVEENIRTIEKDYTFALERNDCSLVENLGMCSHAANTGFNSISLNRGSCSVASNTGISSISLNTSFHSVAANTDSFSVASVTGEHSVSTVLGCCSKAMSKDNNSVAAGTAIYSVAEAAGDVSVAASTGTESSSIAKGNGSVAVNVGENASSVADVENSIAIATGMLGMAKGVLGSWIVLADNDKKEDGSLVIKDVKAFKVDGETIKPDTFYRLIDGKPVEIKK